MKLTIIDGKETLFNDEVKAISGQNKLGNFSLLQNHARFIGIVHGAVEVRRGRKLTKIDVGYGLIHCKENVVRIFAHLPELTAAAT